MTLKDHLVLIGMCKTSVTFTEDSVGGVVVLGHAGKIEFDNTLEERLKLLETVSLPKIRATIFGYVTCKKLIISGNLLQGSSSIRL